MVVGVFNLSGKDYVNYILLFDNYNIYPPYPTKNLRCLVFHRHVDHVLTGPKGRSSSLQRRSPGLGAQQET